VKLTPTASSWFRTSCLRLGYGPAFDRRAERERERERESHPSVQLRSKFDLEAWIRLDVVNDLVIASYKIGDGDAASVGNEFPQLIKVERNELFNLEHIDPVRQASVAGKAFRDGHAALPGYGERPKSVVQIVPAALDHCFARRGRDMNSDVAEEKVSAPSGLLIRR
jgi:hypothetical protein